jgi:Ser/Thr protein kinase RdoA (MazF antagonist)
MAHGLGLERVAPDWPPLTWDEVDRLLRLYPEIGGCDRLCWHSPRPFSAACIAAAAPGLIFVKRHHRRVRDAASLAPEHRFIAHLRRRGVPVADVLNDKAGQSTPMLGDWVYEVHRVAPGDDIYRDALSWSPFQAPEHAAAAGRALAALHDAASDYEAPARGRAHLLSGFTLLSSADLLETLAVTIACRPALASYCALHPWRARAQALLLPYHRRLVPFADRFPPLWSHNDWHPSNLLWRSDGGAAEVSAILDFGLADRCAALVDIATAIERSAVDWLRLEQSGAPLVDYAGLDALLDGYRTLRPLSARDGLALAAILPLVHVEFALAEADYFLDVLGAPDKAEIAIDTYLFGHAAWFGTAQGRALLSHLRRRAALWPES